MLNYWGFGFFFLKHSPMILKEIHRQDHRGSLPLCHPHLTPTSGPEFKPASSCRNDSDTGEGSGLHPPRGMAAPSPSPWPTYRARGSCGSLLTRVPLPGGSPRLPAQTCLASNLSSGLARPSPGVLFLAQLANCFVTLGKSRRRLTPSVSTACCCDPVAHYKRAGWKPRCWR